jgi:hypothetical protein
MPAPHAFGITYLLTKFIPLKQLGRLISQEIILSFSNAPPKESLNKLSRIVLIKMIVELFEKNNETIKDLEEKVAEAFRVFGLAEGFGVEGIPDALDIKNRFNEFIERREKQNKILKF